MVKSPVPETKTSILLITTLFVDVVNTIPPLVELVVNAVLIAAVDPNETVAIEVVSALAKYVVELLNVGVTNDEPVPTEVAPVAVVYHLIVEPVLAVAWIVVVPVPHRVAGVVVKIVFVNPIEDTLEYPGVPPQETILQRYWVAITGVTVVVVAVALEISCHEPPLSTLDCHWKAKPSLLPV